MRRISRLTVAFAAIGLMAVLAVGGCSDEEKSETVVVRPVQIDPSPARTAPSPGELPAWLNREVAAKRARRGSNQRQVLLFANSWLDEFTRGSGVVCVFMTKETNCRRFIGARTPLQKAFASARPLRISRVTPRDGAAVLFSNGRYVEFAELAEIWKVADLDSARARRYFE